MSRHRIVHNLDPDEVVSEFDADDYEEEEDELSPEDREAMDKGTAEVRRALGTESSKVTTSQIQEALWHYYYDVDKSVTYLMKTFIAPAPKPAPKKAPEGTFGSVSFSASHCAPNGDTGADFQERLSSEHNFDSTWDTSSFMSLYPVVKRPKLSHTWYFDDMPWLNVPQNRQTTFIAPKYPSGGLLGGGEAPKMSKLQALAAARKKKNDEKKEQEKALQAEKGVEKLSISDEPQKENLKSTIGAAKRQKLSETSAFHSRRSSSPSKPPALESSGTQNSLPEINQDQETSSTQGYILTNDFFADNSAVTGIPKAAPSAFAQTLFGSAPKPPTSQRPEIFAMPYTSSPSFLAQAFIEPSPDDIVLAAQAKGSNFARTK